ncbi:MAG: hypothetical protein HY535_08840 [Chloroflexi bacterium]|nr:hypothetical protein [Chloroflexota bacterium]
MRGSRDPVAQVAPQAAEPCRHHWLIEPPQGPTSPGVCLLCGARREFKNYLENVGWEVSTASRHPRDVSVYLGLPAADSPLEEQ